MGANDPASKKSAERLSDCRTETTIPFYLAICDEKDFREGKFTRLCENRPEIFDYPEAEREIAKLSKLIAEIHSPKKINPYAY